MRNRFIGSLVLAAVVFCAAARAGEPTLRPSAERLDAAQEKAVRRAVYGRGVVTAFPEEGKYARFTVLVLPEGLKAIYAKKPKATVRVLLKIVEGGRPADALLAAGYIDALVGDVRDGATTAIFPQENFDDVNEALGVPFREGLRRGLVERIAKKESGRAGKEGGPQGPDLTPDLAKEALLRMMRSEPARALGWFKGNVPDEMAKMKIEKQEDGWYEWTGAFRFNPSKAVYTFTVRPLPGARACTFEYEGAFVRKEGRWSASPPKLLRTVLQPGGESK